MLEKTGESLRFIRGSMWVSCAEERTEIKKEVIKLGGRKGQSRKPTSATDHVLLVYSRDKHENSKSVDIRLNQAISLKPQNRG